MTAKLTKFRNKRTIVIAQQCRIKEYVDNLSPTATVVELETRLNALEKYFENFSGIQNSLQEIDEEELISKVRAEFEELYFVLRPSLMVEISKRKDETINESVSIHTEGTSAIKLPKIVLPSFSGDYTKWTTFFETFNTPVHVNKGLDNISRFHYLRSALTDGALSAIQSIEVTDKNYECARKILMDRFDNRKLISQEHIRQIFSLPTIYNASSRSLRELIDNLNVHLRSLAALGRPALQWNDLIVFIVLKKLDAATVDKWEDESPSDRLPTLKELLTFLERRSHTLDARSKMKGKTSISLNSNDKGVKTPKQGTAASFNAFASTSCNFCSDSNHAIYKCTKFLNLTPTERYNEVKRLSLCLNCLRKNHTQARCTSRKCQNCNKKYNTLLHMGSSDTFTTTLAHGRGDGVNSSNTNTQANSPLTLHSSLSTPVLNKIQSRSKIILATALINVCNKIGRLVTCRALLDTGSQINFISENLAQELGIKRTKSLLLINGIGESEVTSKSKLVITLKSRLNPFSIDVEVHVLPSISGNQPDCYIDTSSWCIPNTFELADPTFFKSQRVDLLLGAELFCHLLEQDQLILSNHLPVLQKTVFGWIVMGRVTQSSSKSFHCNLATNNSTSSLEEQLQKFWELERHDCPVKGLSIEEQLCADHFNRTVQRTPTGQFSVKLPFRCDPRMLGNTQEIASRRFQSLQLKLSRNTSLKAAYSDFMTEYQDLPHMTEISSIDIPEVHYFLPHHSVYKVDSSTTKLRVVFDGSAKSTSGVSLNDVLMVGPVVQHDLFSIVIRFRFWQYVFTADISKMYRQILVDPEDRKYQLIMWCDKSPADERIYKLNTVTYGTSAAPYLAARRLNKLAQDEQRNFPDACNVLRDCFYVDDCMTGSDSLEDAKSLQSDLITLLQRGHFELRKFCSNHPSLLEAIPEEFREKFLSINDNNVIKTLGLIWQPSDDVFQFNIEAPAVDNALITKRTILSDLARVFDALGIIGPVIVLGNIFLQQLWKLKLSLDEGLPIQLCSKWCTYREQLTELNSLKIPRHLIPLTSLITVQLHGFADSSESAYGACCYLRCMDPFGQTSVRLICSKSRVAPVKTISLPRLELCAALLLAELIDRLLSILERTNLKVYYYTDSSIVLSWLKSPSYTWNTFVANRVAKIQEITHIHQWNHISSNNNPADLLTRGLLANSLQSSLIWFNGPEFLSCSEETWAHNDLAQLENVPEKRKQKVCLLSSPSMEDLITPIRHSNSILKLQRIIGYCYKFIKNSRILKNSRVYDHLSNEEIQSALYGIIRNVQRLSFPLEFKALSKGKELERSSRLKSLSPFIDEVGIIRVGGRLKNSLMSYGSKHQILLPKNHNFTNMVLSYLHVKHLHAAPQTLLNICRQKYWPIDGKNIARSIVHRCVRCYRTKPTGLGYVMGDLPKERVQPGRPFLTTGIDFCGPFKIHLQIRGRSPVKAYVTVFVCFTTKATHLELVGNLSSEAFIAALKRFISRRGLCQRIFCDNATNFVGSRSQLSELRQLFQSQDLHHLIHKLCQEDRIEWKPIPPKSPHFGGLWEAAVKAAKQHLVRTLADASLTYEELITIITQVEAVLNSRPISPLSSDPNDLESLTPGHFLVGAPLTSLPEPDVTKEPINRLNRFRRMQQLQQIFWKRWSNDYLHHLQQRYKWTTKGKQLDIDSLVIIKEDNTPPLKWPLARVIKLFPGKDGVSRVAEVKTQFRTYKRSTINLFPLPVDDTPSC